MASENFDLKNELFGSYEQSINEKKESLKSIKHTIWSYCREIVSPQDRTVIIKDPFTGDLKEMLMFGSNNYLGLASHPKVKEYVINIIEKYGTGTGGPPHLNGYNSLISEIEEYVAASRKKDSAMLFSSGFSANFSLATSLFNRKTCVIYDEYSHASLIDGIIASRCRGKRFKHNDMEDLAQKLGQVCQDDCDNYIAIEGIYSMDGDLPKMDEILQLKMNFGVQLVVDDAHGTGVLGEFGNGVGEYFHCSEEIDICVGTFSKAIAASGGYIAADEDTILYLRYLSRPYMFSASMPPAALATIYGGYKVMSEEPYRITQLKDNALYALKAIKGLNKGIDVNCESAILVIHSPENMPFEKATKFFHDQGIFLNTIQYPAVAPGEERFRISIMSNHSKEDIDRLVSVVSCCWNTFSK